MLFTSFFPDPEPVRSALLAWYNVAKRDLPWRRHCTHYSVWISEVMLQQTQMSRGTAFFERWMRLFPDLESLAAASEEEVLRAWEGLGYYSRARNILKTARLLAASSSPFPDNVRDLLKLPGIGLYTASAIASIACNKDVACVDANVERVIGRLCDLDLPIRSKEGKSALAELAEGFLTHGRAGEHNQAMMELGALICGKKPLCQDCPLANWCLARKHGTVLMRPVLPAPKGRIPLHLVSAIVLHENRVFLTRRSHGSVWGGLWAFPYGELREGEDMASAAVRIIMEAAGIDASIVQEAALPGCRSIRPLAELKTAYTKYNVTTHFFLFSPDLNLMPDGSSDSPASFCSTPVPSISATPSAPSTASSLSASASSSATPSSLASASSPSVTSAMPPSSDTVSAVAPDSTCAMSTASASSTTVSISPSSSAASGTVTYAATAVATAVASAAATASVAASPNTSAKSPAFAIASVVAVNASATADFATADAATAAQTPSSCSLPCRWASFEELANLPMPPLHKKAANLLFGKKA